MKTEHGSQPRLDLPFPVMSKAGASLWGISSTLSPSLGEPQNLMADASDGTNVYLTCDPLPNAVGYAWYRDGALLAYTDGPSYTDTPGFGYFGYQAAGYDQPNGGFRLGPLSLPLVYVIL